MSDIDICDWCGTEFPSDLALYDIVTGQDSHSGLAAACSPKHMLILGGRVHVIAGDQGETQAVKRAPSADDPTQSRPFATT